MAKAMATAKVSPMARAMAKVSPTVKVRAKVPAEVSAKATQRPADRQRSRCYEFQRILQESN